MIDKEDCFAFVLNRKIKRCKALNVNSCEGCKFYKTKEDFLEELVKYPPDFNKLTGKSLIREG